MTLFGRLFIAASAGLAALFSVLAPAHGQNCTGSPVTGFTCTRADGTAAIGSVFSASEAGGRRNVSLTLIEELVEEEAAPSGGGGGEGPTGFDLFAFGGVGWQDYDTENVLGQEGTTYGGLFGASYRGDNFIAGIAGDVSSSDVDFSLAGGTRDTTEYGVQVFGTVFPFDHFFLSGAARIGFVDIDTRRIVSAGNIARGDTDGNTYGLTGGVGYSLPLGTATVVGLSGWMAWERTETDGYSESGAVADTSPGSSPQPSNLTFKDDNYNTLDGILRLEVAHAIQLGDVTLVPSARADYVHEFNTDTRTIDAFLPPGVAGDQTVVGYRTNDPDRNYFRLGAALTAAFDQGTSISADYSGLVGHSWREEHVITIGLRHRF